MADPHRVCCQHCYITYDLCDGKECAHDVHSEPPEPYGLDLRSCAFIGFCERHCASVRAKGSRAGQYTDNQPAGFRAAALAAGDSADAAIGKAVLTVTISIESLIRILRRHGVTPSQILCIVFDVKAEGR